MPPSVVLHFGVHRIRLNGDTNFIILHKIVPENYVLRIHLVHVIYDCATSSDGCVPINETVRRRIGNNIFCLSDSKW